MALKQITDPALLDSTGQKILKEMQIQNAYLALLAQDKITTLDNTWDKVAALVRATAKRFMALAINLLTRGRTRLAATKSITITPGA